MVNKKHGLFTRADEQAFETFAVYCGLALHHAKVSVVIGFIYSLYLGYEVPNIIWEVELNMNMTN